MLIPPTHSGGHILDLVISRNNTQLVQPVSVAEGIGDYYSTLTNRGIAMEKKKVVKRTFHQFKKLDMVKFLPYGYAFQNDKNRTTTKFTLATQYHNVVSD